MEKVDKKLQEELCSLSTRDALVRFHVGRAVNGDITLERALLNIIILQKNQIEKLENDISVANATRKGDYQ